VIHEADAGLGARIVAVGERTPKPHGGGKIAAVEDYGKAVSLSPKTTKYLLAYGDALLDQDKGEDAVAQYMAAVLIDPSADNLTAEAEGHLYLSQYKEADEALDKALKADPKSYYAYAIKARSALNQDQLNLAEENALTALKLNADSGLARYYLAKVRDKQGRSKEALDLFRQCEKKWPRDAQVQDYIGLMLFDLERYGESIPAFDKALQFNPRLTDAQLDRALSELRLERWQAAATDASAVIKAEPDRATPYIRRAYAYWKLGRDHEAKDDYDKAVQLNPNSHLALEERGDFLRHQHDYDAAQKDAEASLALPKPTADTYVLAGQVAEGLRNYAKAEDHYNSALKMDNANPWLYENRAWARLYQEKWAGALDDCNELIRRVPNRAEAYYCRAEVHVAMKEAEKSLPDLNQALKLKKTYWAALYERARTYHDLARTGLAIADFTALINADYRTAEAFYYRAAAYENDKQFGKAEADYKEALKRADPSWAGTVAVRLRNLGKASGAAPSLEIQDAPQHVGRHDDGAT